MANTSVRWWLLLVLVPVLGGLFWLGEERVEVDTDITTSIPGGDPVLADASYILKHHPALDRIAIDLALEGGGADADRLADAADRVVARLTASGLFEEVGVGRTGLALAGLLTTVADQLPALFSAEELERAVTPQLEPAQVRAALEARRRELLQLEGVGQAELMAKDPLGLRLLVLGRLQQLTSGGQARFHRDHLVTLDDKHLLLLANPKGRGSDTRFARQLVALFQQLQQEVNAPVAGQTTMLPRVSVAVAGGFRAALDNEEIIRDDTNLLLLLATLGIAVLFVACFPRPLFGLLAMLPALAGVSVGLLVYSLLFDSISALALGFGGALVSITVDQGAAYLLFLDRNHTTTGRAAAREIWWAGVFSTVTNASAFLALHFSGYPLLEQLGVFAALALVFSFAFVHLVFPLIFPRLPAARRPARLPLERLLGRISVGKGWPGPVAALLLGLTMLAWARPEFLVDLTAMNTVRPQTLAAEARVKAAWGDIMNRVYLLQDAPTLDALQRRGDDVASFLDGQRTGERLSAAFAPAMLIPGEQRTRQNRAAWQHYWTPARQQALAATLGGAATELGFAPAAFAPFLATVAGQTAVQPGQVPPALHELFGISAARNGAGWIWLGAVTPGPRYDAAAFAAAAARQGYRVFDPQLFSDRLAAHLDSAFLRMLGIIGAAVVVILTVLFFDLRLVALALAPLVFALVCTLGTLKLLGHPLDIPGLMLSIIVLGLGIDASLFFIRAYQQLQGESHDSHGPVRLAIFMTSAAMLIGMGTMAMASHAVLRSAGITGTVATLYIVLGAFAILPPFLRRIYPPAGEGRPWETRPAGQARASVARRFRFLDPHLRLFAWFKLRLDPMFPRLAELVGPARTLLDVGCGWGVPAAWLLSRLPEARVWAVEPDPARARVATRIFGERGQVRTAAAPTLPDAGTLADVALLLDVAHHLSGDELRATLQGLRARLAPGGRLVLRTTVPSAKRLPWERWLERLHRALRPGGGGTGRTLHFYGVDELSGLLTGCGFTLTEVSPSAPGREETWFVAVSP